MSDTAKPPVATLAGVTLPGDHRPLGADALPDHLSVLRATDDGGNWRRLPPAPGMALHAGDVLYLRSDAFRALGARAFTVDGSVFGGAGEAPPEHVQLQAHELTHVLQQGAPRVTPLNEAQAEALERAAQRIEEMVLHRPAQGR